MSMQQEEPSNNHHKKQQNALLMLSSIDEIVNSSHSIAKPAEKEDSVVIENLLRHVVGPAGLWQWSIVLLLAFSSPSLLLFDNFAVSRPLFRCRYNDTMEMYFEQQNFTFEDIPQADAGVCQSKMVMFKPRTGHKIMSSIDEEWTLVGDDAKWIQLGSSLYLISPTVGLLVSGRFIDHFGRRFGVIFFGMFATLPGFLVSISPNTAFYYFFRFISGVASSGRLLSALILIREITTPEHRLKFYLVFQFIAMFCSRSLQSVLAQLVTRWRTFNAIICAPSLLFIVYFCFVPESPQWLVARMDDSHAMQVMKEGIRLNRQFKRIRIDLKDFRFTEDLHSSIKRRRSSALARTGINSAIPATPPVSLFQRLLECLQEICPSKSEAKVAIAVGLLLGLQGLAMYGLLFYAHFVKLSIPWANFYNALMLLVGGTMASLLLKLSSIGRKWSLVFVNFLGAASLIMAGLLCMFFKLRHDQYTNSLMIVATNFALALLVASETVLLYHLPGLFRQKMSFVNVYAWSRLMVVFCCQINELAWNNQEHGLPVLIYGSCLVVAVILLLILPVPSNSRSGFNY